MCGHMKGLCWGGGKLPSFNLYNYTVSNSVSLRTISRTETGNYTAWTRLTSSITADGSLLRAVGSGLQVMLEY